MTACFDTQLAYERRLEDDESKRHPQDGDDGTVFCELCHDECLTCVGPRAIDCLACDLDGTGADPSNPVLDADPARASRSYEHAYLLPEHTGGISGNCVRLCPDGMWHEPASAST